MTRFFKQQAHRHGGAMETGDHFKNGASPKSRTRVGVRFNKQIDTTN
jgi:hypothetical protein